MTPYHPFRSATAKEQYLKLYDIRVQKWPVDSQTRLVDTSYGQTFVRMSGPSGAPPLVLLHGAGGDSLQWIPNIEALSRSYRVYAVDNIYDYGRSIYRQSIKNPDDYVNWLDELFSVLELGNNIKLMGLSYGGWLTSQYALRFPDRLDKIVLLAPAGTVLPIRLVNPTVLADVELHSIKVPTLYIVGENEKICSAQKAIQRLHRVAPHIKTEVIRDAGHDVTFVQEDLVNTKVLEFLTQR